MTSSEKFFMTFVASILTLSYVVTSEKTHILEAEGGATTGEVKMRESASNGASILLNNGDYISYSFTTTEGCSVVVLNVRYSEGSTVDTATVLIDGQDIGSFRTTVRSNGPDPWNEFYDSGQVGDETTLAAGEHTVKISVSTTDEYGMEVDYIQLRTTCDITPYANEDATGADTTTGQDSTATEGGATARPAGSDSIDGTNTELTERKSLTGGQIAGIAAGTATVVIAVTGVLGLLVTIIQCLRKGREDGGR